MRPSRNEAKLATISGRAAEVPRWRMWNAAPQARPVAIDDQVEDLVVAHLDFGVDPPQEVEKIVLAAIDAAEQIIVDLSDHGEDGVVVKKLMNFAWSARANRTSRMRSCVDRSRSPGKNLLKSREVTAAPVVGRQDFGTGHK